jgi:hypothetical protein
MVASCLRTDAVLSAFLLRRESFALNASQLQKQCGNAKHQENHFS